MTLDVFNLLCWFEPLFCETMVPWSMEVLHLISLYGIVGQRYRKTYYNYMHKYVKHMHTYIYIICTYMQSYRISLVFYLWHCWCEASASRYWCSKFTDENQGILIFDPSNNRLSHVDTRAVSWSCCALLEVKQFWIVSCFVGMIGCRCFWIHLLSDLIFWKLLLPAQVTFGSWTSTHVSFTSPMMMWLKVVQVDGLVDVFLLTLMMWVLFYEIPGHVDAFNSILDGYKPISFA